MNKSARNFTIDIVRILAALWVSLDHFINNTWAHQAFKYDYQTAGELNSFGHFTHILGAGYLGVEIFFIISGIAIGYCIQKETPIDFISSRILRIFPTFIICNFLVFIVGYRYFNSSNFHDLELILKSFLLYNNEFVFFGPIWAAWTLWIEVKFYLMSYFFLQIYSKFRVEFLFYFWVFIWFTLYIFKLEIPHEISRLLNIDQAPYFILGLLISRFKNLKSLLMHSLFALLQILIILNDISNKLKFDNNLSNRFIVELIFLILLALLFFSPFIKISKYESWKLIYNFAKCTYVFYLIHEAFGLILIYEILKFMKMNVTTLLLVIVLLFVFSYAFQILIENKIIREFRRWRVRYSNHSQP